jgi:hypothetical protein
MHAVRKVHANQRVLELNGLRQILIYADDGNVLGEEQTMF